MKTKPKRSVEEERHLLWIEQNGRLLLWQRPPDSRLMPGFWELPEQAQLPDVQPGIILGEFRHGITFHNYRFVIHKAVPDGSLAGCRWLDENELATAPLSTVLRKAQKLLKATYARAASSSH